MPDCTAFIGTSNMDLKSLDERFQTRLHQWTVRCPSTDELKAFLRRWKLKDSQCAQIAVGSGGNVRAALNPQLSTLNLPTPPPRCHPVQVWKIVPK